MKEVVGYECDDGVCCQIYGLVHLNKEDTNCDSASSTVFQERETPQTPRLQVMKTSPSHVYNINSSSELQRIKFQFLTIPNFKYLSYLR